MGDLVGPQSPGGGGQEGAVNLPGTQGQASVPSALPSRAYGKSCLRVRTCP